MRGGGQTSAGARGRCGPGAAEGAPGTLGSTCGGRSWSEEAKSGGWEGTLPASINSA